MSARFRGALLVVAVAGLPAAASAQDLARRVDEVGDGTVRFSYATRPDVEICDQGIRIGEHRMWWRSHGWNDMATHCRMGPAEVELRVRDGRVRDVELIRSERDRTAGATDLGPVEPGEAVEYLLDVARRPSGADEDAVFPVVLADVDAVWRDLLDLARERSAPRASRKSALFWVGQEAADAATSGLSEVALADDEDQDVRDAAVFALSQRPDDESVPVLMRVARTANQAKTRRTAMFWLAQSDDPRVVAFFEEILVGG
jgi:hypothetical protein